MFIAIQNKMNSSIRGAGVLMDDCKTYQIQWWNEDGLSMMTQEPAKSFNRLVWNVLVFEFPEPEIWTRDEVLTREG